MNFTEWARLTSKETYSFVPYGLVREILLTSIRVVLEEFMSNRAEADFCIQGIGRIFLNYRKCHNTFAKEGESEYVMKWTIDFRPSENLKELINEKRDIKSMLISGSIPLYPEEYEQTKRGRKKELEDVEEETEDGGVKITRKEKHPTQTRKYVIRKGNGKYKKRKKPPKKEIDFSYLLPDEDDL